MIFSSPKLWGSSLRNPGFRSSAWRQRFDLSEIARLRYPLLFSLFLWPFSALAETADVTTPAVDFTASVESALEKLDATNLEDDWYFTMDVVEEDELRIIHSDPHRDKYERRQLISVNGVAPDAERKEEFHDAEVERVDGLDPDNLGYSYMVDVQTLQLLETGEDRAKFSFVPRVKALEESADKIQGLLLLNLKSRQIEQIEITNTEQLSPAFSVTVDTYRLTLQFEQQQGENLLSKLESHAAGKAGFVKSFDSLVGISFGDYKRAAPAP